MTGLLGSSGAILSWLFLMGLGGGIWVSGFGKVLILGADIWHSLLWVLLLGFCCPPVLRIVWLVCAA